MGQFQELEEIKSEIAKLTDVVKAHAGNGKDGTLDTAALAETVKGLVDKQVANQMAEFAQDKPRRKGEVIGPPGFEAVSKGVVRKGKFAGKGVDDALFVNWLLEKARVHYPNSVRQASKDLSEIVSKALDATTAGSGDEYVPTGMAAQLWLDLFLQSKIVGAIGTVPMPTDPFDMPLGFGAITWRKGTKNTATTASDPASAKGTLTSTEVIAEVDCAYDLDEDAVFAVLPSLKTEIARSGAEAVDAFALNADSTDAATGNINMDDANPPDDSYFLSNGQDGIRHLALVDNTSQGSDVNAALDDTKMRTFLGKLDKYAADPQNVPLIVDAVTYVGSMLGLTNVVTMDKFGANAVILTGQLASYAGHPIILSASMHRTAADGKVDAADNGSKGQIAAFHRSMWRVGFRRELLIELDRDIKKRQLVLVASFREAIAARGTRSTAKHAAVAYNIT